MKIVGLLLAAGSAKRFGSDKLLHPLLHGVPIAVQAARHLRHEISTVFAVLHPGSDELSALLKAEGCEVVVCDNADEGMGASLACAVRDALASGAPIAAPYFRTRRGHPVGISGTFRVELEGLGADKGAREVLAAHEGELVKVPVGDPGVVRDIDKPEDLTPPIVV